MTALLSTFKSRSYAGEADLPAIADLVNSCKAADNLDGWTSVEALQYEFAAPDFDVARDMQLWEDIDGKLCAYADCWIPKPTKALTEFFGFFIRPDIRRHGLEEQVLAWAENRVREAGREHQLPLRLRSGVRGDQTARLKLLEHHGFRADRYFYRMTRSLTEPIPELQLPAGFTVRPLQRDEVAAWVEMFNQTFIDHWNFIPLTVEDRQHWMSESNYFPDLDLVAAAPNGILAAFCYSCIDIQENIRNGRQEGWIADLGTRRGFRKLGLGRAMLLSGLQRLKANGLETALLSVDAKNPSGALRLYESVGFRKLHTSVSYVKEVAL